MLIGTGIITNANGNHNELASFISLISQILTEDWRVNSVSFLSELFLQTNLSNYLLHMNLRKRNLRWTSLKKTTRSVVFIHTLHFRPFQASYKYEFKGASLFSALVPFQLLLSFFELYWHGTSLS